MTWIVRTTYRYKRPPVAIAVPEVVTIRDKTRRKASIGLLAASMILAIVGCAPVAESRQDAPDAPPGVSWEGGSQSHTDATGATWTFPQDLSRNPDRGCVTWRGGDGIVRTVCW